MFRNRRFRKRLLVGNRAVGGERRDRELEENSVSRIAFVFLTDVDAERRRFVRNFKVEAEIRSPGRAAHIRRMEEVARARVAAARLTRLERRDRAGIRERRRRNRASTLEIRR